MKEVYILEARWHDTINRIRHNEIIGVYDTPTKLETAKKLVEMKLHEYKSISFNVNKEIHLF